MGVESQQGMDKEEVQQSSHPKDEIQMLKHLWHRRIIRISRDFKVSNDRSESKFSMSLRMPNRSEDRKDIRLRVRGESGSTSLDQLKVEAFSCMVSKLKEEGLWDKLISEERPVASKEEPPLPARLSLSDIAEDQRVTDNPVLKDQEKPEESSLLPFELCQDDFTIFHSLEQKNLLQHDTEFSGNQFEGMTCLVTCSIPVLKQELQVAGHGMRKRDAKKEAIYGLITRLRGSGIWEQLIQRDHIRATVNDDLLYMMHFGTQTLNDANAKLRSLMKVQAKNTRPIQSDKGTSNAYKTKRSEQLAQSLRKFRQSKDPKVLAIQSATSTLPVNERKDEILGLIKKETYSIIVAETGSGKSTQVPQLILNDAIEEGKGGHCNVLCIQPRRIAARMLAQRVAHERVENIGNTVGYMIRFGIRRPAKGGSITYCTTGLALNMLQDNPELLNSFSHIILDEVHVRDIDIDFVMLLLKSHIDKCRAAGQLTPKVVVMSATVDVDLFASYFSNIDSEGRPTPAPHVSIPGRQFHVKSHYLDEVINTLTDSLKADVLTWCLKEPATAKFLKNHYHNFAPEVEAEAEEAQDKPEDDDLGKSPPTLGESDATMPLSRPAGLKQVDDASVVPTGLIAAVTHHLLSTTDSGAILIFLPGLSQIIATESQILQAAEMLGLDFADGNKYKLLKLHSSLPEELANLERETPESCRRILLATDIAEASLTIPDVKYLIDSGKVNQLMYDPWSRSHQMSCSWASQSSTVQRAGRAGRVHDGDYFFMGSKDCFDSLRVTKSPEILRSDLQSVCLRAKLSNPSSTIREFLQQAIESPEITDIDMAVNSLKQLQALDSNEKMTNLGSLASHMPILPPHLAKLVIMGAIFRCLDPVLIIATLGQQSNFFYRGSDDQQRLNAWNNQSAFAGQSSSDHLSTVNAFKAVRSVWIEEGWRAAHKFAISKNVYLPVYREAFLTSNQILRQLEQAQLVDRWLLTGKDAEGRFGGPKLNVNSNNVPLIKALLLHCLYPRLAAPNPDSNSTFATQTEQKAVLFSGSMTKTGRKAPRALLVFNQKFLWGKPPHITAFKEASIVTPLAASLFGGQVTVHRSSMIMDSWLRMGVEVLDAASTPKQVIDDMILFREALHKALNTAFESYRSDFEILQNKKTRGTFFNARSDFCMNLQQVVTGILNRDCDTARATAPSAWNAHDLSHYSD
ncbi:Uncharacterized protein PECH_006324 [Penicillium ucsense]|uniref:Uncharacterized protein n=1 Tax=Penicillium ucsense TaxID=2839758 RepID=A0A8J8W6I6_9EURO|nr:Uncharacterized protein PECM_001455 [Penicillium ucsense]KAF7739118.1 Uncharacterized protein PECH_006324 [Penicillium ucsense]